MTRAEPLVRYRSIIGILRSRFGSLVAAVFLVAGCTAQPSATAAPSLPATVGASATAVPSASVDLGAASADLDRLLELLEVIHPEPFHGVPRDEWVARMEEIRAELPRATPEESMVAVMGLVAMLSREGRDGHQIAFPTDGGLMLPLRVFEFFDGVFVTDALDATLIGARITAVEGRPIDEVLTALDPLVARDSPATVPWFRPFYLLRADVLEGLGMVDGDAAVTLTLEPADGGATRETTLQTIGFADYNDWGGPFGLIHLPEREGLRFTAHEPRFWIEDLDDGVLYARLSQVQAVATSEIAAFADAAADPDVTRVIFDLRQNPGGNNFTYPPLLRALQEIDTPLWVLTDRGTFSAASNLTTEIEQSTDARFAGEPMGGGLNFWDDVQFVEFENLPIPMSIGISTLYWEKSFPKDPRLTIEPDLAVPYRSDDYFGGVDAGLEAVLEAP